MGSSTKLKVMVLATAAALVCCCVVAYLAGYFYLSDVKLDPTKVGFTTYYEYWYWYRTDPAYTRLLRIALLKAVCVILAPALIFVVAVTRHRQSLYGEARFANAGEVRRSGLMENTGIIVGKYRSRYLMLSGQQFVLLAAPTRSGKGVGIVIPNLLNFKDSVVVLDIKQENFDITAGFRAANGHQVFLFNPFAEDKRTHRYNPLTYIRDDPALRIGDILTIGTILYPPEGKDGTGKDAFWSEQARNLFLGIALLVCETPDVPRTMGEVLRQASGYGVKVNTYLNNVIQRRWDQGRALSPACVDSLNRFMDNSENTFTGILATFNAALTIWASPIVDAATSSSDFLLSEVRRQHMTIYIGITPDYLPAATPLLNIIFSQLLNLNLRDRPDRDPSLRYQCLLLMDEFTAIGKVQIIAKSIGFMAGYNMRLLPIIQSLAQLESTYGANDARTLVTNHALQILFAPREQKDANDYSEMLGYSTVKDKSLSRPTALNFQKGASRSDTVSDRKRALLLPQELKELGKDNEIIVLENCKPILAKKIRYYEEPVFKARLLPAPHIPQIDLDQYTAIVHASRVYNYNAQIQLTPTSPAPPASTGQAQTGTP